MTFITAHWPWFVGAGIVIIVLVVTSGILPAMNVPGLPTPGSPDDE